MCRYGTNYGWSDRDGRCSPLQLRLFYYFDGSVCAPASRAARSANHPRTHLTNKTCTGKNPTEHKIAMLGPICTRFYALESMDAMPSRLNTSRPLMRIV
mmetsp:Transcript_16881/g.46651  ORF Transcript_16881/g.46651 Transcript_16881/m.46651 type:complete len:99 (-) Transcript_16881:474-770(-)